MANKGAVKSTDDLLTDLIDHSQDMFETAIAVLEKDILRLLSRIKTNKDGMFRGPRTTFASAVALHRQLSELFAETYEDAANEHVKQYKFINKEVRDVYKELEANVTAFSEVNKDILKVLRQQDYQLHRTLSRETQLQVANAVYSEVIGLGNIERLENTIRGLLTGYEDVRGTPLATYAKTYAQDQIMNYHARSNKALGDDNNVERWEYVGDIIETSRDFCERNLDKVRTTREWETIGIEQDWQGKSCSDIFVCRGGYNCRHHFQAVIID